MAGVIGADYASQRLKGASFLDAEILAGIIGVAAGVLAILFQRRSEFVSSLRAEWHACLRAMATVRTLYLRTDPGEGDYLAAYAVLSEAIDGMRAVYRNLGETEGQVGLYPFSTLHDVRLMLEMDFMRGGAPSFALRQQRLGQITGMWRLFRRRFLNELETPEADRPITKRLALDRRRGGIGFWRRLVRRLPKGQILTDDDIAIG